MLNTAAPTSFDIPRKAWTQEDLRTTEQTLTSKYGSLEELYNRYVSYGLSTSEYEAMVTLRKIRFLQGE